MVAVLWQAGISDYVKVHQECSSTPGLLNSSTEACCCAMARRRWAALLDMDFNPYSAHILLARLKQGRSIGRLAQANLHLGLRRQANSACQLPPQRILSSPARFYLGAVGADGLAPDL